MGKTRLIAFDLDGTLTQHKTPLAQPNLGVLDSLGEKYKLLMVGAGMCSRIFRQMNGYPIDIIGNYGMQFCTYNAETKALDKVFDMHAPCDRESVERRITALRERFGYTEYTGDNVEYHDSGCVTFPLLGTKADIAAKLAFDPDRSKRKPLYPAVRDAFPDYTVFIGGSSSFDFAPFPYNKYYALDKYCAEYGYSHDEVVYVGDDYGPGGNDEAVYLSDFTFVRVDDYTRFGEYMREYL
ncbi:MAG: HAD hydrolase family protein [Eubacteriales bacterium]|nr:HAD hydrolase family protein [Eubacteriales bacterium]